MINGMLDCLSARPVFFSLTHWNLSKVEWLFESRFPLLLMGGITPKKRLGRKLHTGCRFILAILRSLDGQMVAEDAALVALDFLPICSRAIMRHVAGAWNNCYPRVLKARGEWKELLKELLDKSVQNPLHMWRKNLRHLM